MFDPAPTERPAERSAATTLLTLFATAAASLVCLAAAVGPALA